MTGKVVDVTAAVIRREGKYLIAKRGPNGHLAGLWEFPGGKLKDGEGAEVGLMRELREELGSVVGVGSAIGGYTHDYGGAIGTIRLRAYCCHLIEGEPQPTVHSSLRWVMPEDMLYYTFAPADLPIVQALQRKRSVTETTG